MGDGRTVGYERTDLGAGTVERTADGQTVVSVQGFHLRGVGNTKKPARLVSVTPEGDLD